MIEISSEKFETIVERAIAKVPSPYKEKLQNIAFFVLDEPSPEQRKRAHVPAQSSLYGLYEGIPLTKRGGVEPTAPPDTITIYRLPHILEAQSVAELELMVYKTVWHEVAHYFGLDHDRIDAIENQQLR